MKSENFTDLDKMTLLKPDAREEVVVEVKNLKKHFAQKKGLMSVMSKSRDQVIPAVDDVSFLVRENETLGLVGESGCGKTTTGKSILKLTGATAGNIMYKGTDITHLNTAEFRPYRKEMQMIFQDLDAALNPKIRIRNILSEAVRIHHPDMLDSDVDQRINSLMEMVNLKRNKLSNFPSELSGGEKRRVGIARVLAVGPKFIVADEPTSALDVSIQAQVVNLMLDLQRDLGLSYLFISHDLQLVELMSHNVAVMYLGRIVEYGASQLVAKQSRHPYTSILWASLVAMENKEAADGESEQKDNWGVFDFARPVNGCRFAPRCPIYAQMGRPKECTDPANEPKLRDVGSGHMVACHFPL